MVTVGSVDKCCVGGFPEDHDTVTYANGNRYYKYKVWAISIPMFKQVGAKTKNFSLEKGLLGKKVWKDKNAEVVYAAFRGNIFQEREDGVCGVPKNIEDHNLGEGKTYELIDNFDDAQPFKKQLGVFFIGRGSITSIHYVKYWGAIITPRRQLSITKPSGC